MDFSEAYDAHMSRVHAFFAYRTLSREDAEDLTQLTFERALRAWPRYDAKRSPVDAWLLVIARNLLIDHYRAGGRRATEPVDEDLADRLPDARSRSPVLGPAPAVAAALASLGDRERELIALRFGADLTGQDIATVSGLTLANVQQVLSRSLRRLRAELEGSGQQGGEGEQREAGSRQRGDSGEQ